MCVLAWLTVLCVTQTDPRNQDQSLSELYLFLLTTNHTPRARFDASVPHLHIQIPSPRHKQCPQHNVRVDLRRSCVCGQDWYWQRCLAISGKQQSRVHPSPTATYQRPLQVSHSHHHALLVSHPPTRPVHTERHVHQHSDVLVLQQRQTRQIII